MQTDPAVGELLMLLYALLLGTAAWHKLRRFGDFAAVVEAYRVVPHALVPVAARLVPSLEVALALALLWAPLRSAAAWAVALLLATYAAAIALNLRRGRRDLDCGCAGPNDRRPIAAWMVLRNMVLAAAALLLGLPWKPRGFEPVDALTVVGGVAVASLLYVATDRLLGQIAPRGAALRRPS
jgi:hypothetical protein